MMHELALIGSVLLMFAELGRELLASVWRLLCAR